MDETRNKHAVLYLSHGAGPLPVLGDEGHVEMVETLKRIATRIPKPSAILVVSAHWEASSPTVLTGDQPELYYDYYGLPEESYALRYPAPGDPKLAVSVGKALDAKKLDWRTESARGFDHGMFVPLMIMYPEADIPCVQVSLVQGLDAAAHIELGEALADVDAENLLIVGSGFSFHNMQAFFRSDTPETREWNAAFQGWLAATCSAPALSYAAMRDRLLGWTSAPHARYCHPREEHLLPLHVCCGAAGRPCDERFDLTIIGKQAGMYLWH